MREEHQTQGQDRGRRHHRQHRRGGVLRDHQGAHKARRRRPGRHDEGGPEAGHPRFAGVRLRAQARHGSDGRDRARHHDGRPFGGSSSDLSRHGQHRVQDRQRHRRHAGDIVRHRRPGVRDTGRHRPRDARFDVQEPCCEGESGEARFLGRQIHRAPHRRPEGQGRLEGGGRRMGVQDALEELPPGQAPAGHRRQERGAHRFHEDHHQPLLRDHGRGIGQTRLREGCGCRDVDGRVQRPAARLHPDPSLRDRRGSRGDDGRHRSRRGPGACGARGLLPQGSR